MLVANSGKRNLEASHTLVTAFHAFRASKVRRDSSTDLSNRLGLLLLRRKKQRTWEWHEKQAGG
jgi:hypothetical protein